jgi:hypothetical protein
MPTRVLPRPHPQLTYYIPMHVVISKYVINAYLLQLLRFAALQHDFSFVVCP